MLLTLYIEVKIVRVYVLKPCDLVNIGYKLKLIVCFISLS